MQAPTKKVRGFVVMLYRVFETKLLAAKDNQLELQPGEILLKVSPTVFDSRGSHGRVLLTSRRVILRCGRSVELHHRDIAMVEELNYKVVIPPGMPCLVLHATVPGSKLPETHTVVFYSYESRAHWVLYLREMQHAFRVANALLDRSIELDASCRINTLTTLNKLKCRANMDILVHSPLGDESYFQIQRRLEPRVVLNDYLAWNESQRNWVDVSQALLNDVMALMYSNLSADASCVELDALRVSPMYAEGFRERVGELQHAQLDDLSPAAQLAFFINVLNVLIMHAYIECGLPTCEMDVRFISRYAMYSIGGLLFSINDIYHGLLRGNAAHPWFSAPLIDGSDVRNRHVQAAPCNPNVHFAVCWHMEDSPPPRDLDEENVGPMLHAAAAEMVMNQVEFGPDGTVVLPWIFNYYAADFPADPLAFVAPHSIGAQARQLKLIMARGDAALAVRYTTPKFSFRPHPLRSL